MIESAIATMARFERFSMPWFHSAPIGAATKPERRVCGPDVLTHPFMDEHVIVGTPA